MEGCVKDFLQKKGYTVNDNAMTVIQACDDWYSNRIIEDFHKRKTLNGIPYELNRLNFGKRCCSDDANLCEVLEINAGDGEQADFVNDALGKSEFNTQYRKQLLTAAVQKAMSVMYCQTVLVPGRWAGARPEQTG